MEKVACVEWQDSGWTAPEFSLFLGKNDGKVQCLILREFPQHRNREREAQKLSRLAQGPIQQRSGDLKKSKEIFWGSLEEFPRQLAIFS